MKMAAEYLERAHQFERMASHEINPKLKAEFEHQALAYYELAAKRAHDMRPSVPERKDTSE